MHSPLVRVLIVDDSRVVRAILRTALSSHDSIKVVGEASDGLEALDRIQKLRPDVVTLNVEMPRMNGLELLERVAGKLPVSFVMCSTLTQEGAETTLEALELGAFDYIAKPEQGGFAGKAVFREELYSKILSAHRAKSRAHRVATRSKAAGRVRCLPSGRHQGWVVGIGSSCGGTQALRSILPVFPGNFAPIVVTQHMPEQFTGAFADRLDQVCAMQVLEARDGMPLHQGTILIAPGNRHMTFKNDRGETLVKLDRGPKVSGHRPSVDVMFTSLARVCGPTCIGAILTGMGHDGAAGIKRLHEAGAVTLAQDEATSLVYGMPKEAVETGCVDRSLPLMQIPHAIPRLMCKRSAARV